MKKFILASVVSLASLCSVSAQQVKLSFNPEKGSKYEYHTEMVQNIKTMVMGQEILAEMAMGVTYLMEIIDKEEDTTTMQFTYNGIAYAVSSSFMKMEYDSKKPNENPSDIDIMLSKMFSEMLGKSFVAVFAADGTTLSLTGMETIGENMTNAIAGDGQMLAQLGAQMKQQFSGDAVKNMFEQSFKFYPANPVRTGNSWNTEIATTLNNFSVISKTKYTLKSVNRGVATITFVTKMDMNPETSLMEGEFVGTQTGTMGIDTKTGIPLTLNASSKMNGVVKASGVDVQMVFESTTKTTTKKIE